MAELIQTPDKTEFTTRLGELDGKGASADVRLSSLYNINMSKWNDEVFCNLNFRDLSIGSDITTLDKGLIEVVKGDMKFQSWVLNDGVLEYCIGFASCPTKFDLEFDILDSGNLAYHFQDTLENEWKRDPIGMTLEQYLEKTTRPDNVVGSYAVYFRKDGATARNNQYKTGKFKHLYRWVVTDADGKQAWCEPLRIQDGKLIIGLPADWMRSAKYPVFAMGAGDTIGYTSIGATGQGSWSDIIIASRFASTSAGNANPGTFYFYGQYDVGSGTGNAVGGAYEDNAGTVDGQDKLSTADAVMTNITTVDSWWNAAITWLNIANGTDYWLAVNCDNDVKINYDNVSPGYEDSEWKARTYDGTLPDPYLSGLSNWTKENSIYVDYTAAAGGLPLLLVVDKMGGSCNTMRGL